MGKPRIKKLGLIGGGRWSRVLINVLLEVLPVEWELLWVSRHGHEPATQWSQLHGAGRVRVVAELSDSQLSELQAAVVATDPHNHAPFARKLLSARVPTFCEKPLVLDVHQAEELERLAVDMNCPLGIDLELSFASYLEQFAERTRELNAQRIDIQWRDPWSEQRYGETKYSDVTTNIVDDMFPHCWSLLRGCTDRSQWQVVSVDTDPGGDVHLELRSGPVLACIRLSRRASQRTRIVDLDRGTVSLDFSSEPGVIDQNGERQSLTWQTARPLTRSLQSFVDVVEQHMHSQSAEWTAWPLSVVACREAVRISTQAAALLFARQWQQLQATAGPRTRAVAAERQRLIFDMFVPWAASQGRRIAFTDPEQLDAFYAEIEQRLEQGEALGRNCR